jgi:hypothetical protein
VALAIGYALLGAPRWRFMLASERVSRKALALRSAGQGDDIEPIRPAYARYPAYGGYEPAKETVALPKVPAGAAPVVTRRSSWVVLVATGVLGLLLAYNAVAWVARYVLGTDNSYIQIDSRLANTLPPGTSVVGRDLLDMFLLPKQNVYAFSYLNLQGNALDPAYVAERRIPYTILNDQSLLQGYGGANPLYYDWVKQNGKLVDSFNGRRYGTYVYSMDYRKPVETFDANSLALNHTAVASSSEDPKQFPPQAAFDGKITTRWSSAATDNEWIYVDLGKSQSFKRVQLYWEAAFAQSFALQVSEDAKTWTTFYSTDKGTGGLQTIDAPATGRYVRLLMTKRGTQYGYSLWEFAILP